MLRAVNHYYIAYGYEDDGYQETDFVTDPLGHQVKNDFADYQTALKCAKIAHREEIDYWKHESECHRDEGDEIFNTYVMRTSERYDDYECAVITGWKSKVTEYEQEEDEDGE